MDLTPQMLRVIVVKKDQRSHFYTRYRNSTGAFPVSIIHGCISFPVHSGMRTEACAWSHDSVFFVFYGKFAHPYIVEYDFKKCREKKRYNISGLFTCAPWECEQMYMTYFEGLLIIGMTWCVLDHRDLVSGSDDEASASESDETYSWYRQLGSIHCNTNSFIMLPPEAFPEETTNNHLIATLQVYGQPLVGLSFQVGQGVGGVDGRIHVWQTTDIFLCK